MNIILDSDSSFIQDAKKHFEGLHECILQPKNFPDGEFFVQIPKTLRNQECYLYVSMTPKNVFDILITIDTLKRASARKVTLVTPYLPYSRQDRRADVRTPISAKVLANMLETAGCDHVITMDVHALQIEGFYNIPFDNLQGSSLLLRNILMSDPMRLNDSQTILVAPDAGAAKRTRHLAAKFDLPMAILDKKRISATEVESYLIGDVQNMHCIMLDDMISSGGTMIEGAAVLKRNGALSVHAGCIHMLGDPSKLDHNISTLHFYDTIGKEYDHKNFGIQWKCFDLFRKAQAADALNGSISSMFQ